MTDRPSTAPGCERGEAVLAFEAEGIVRGQVEVGNDLHAVLVMGVREESGRPAVIQPCEAFGRLPAARLLGEQGKLVGHAVHQIRIVLRNLPGHRYWPDLRIVAIEFQPPEQTGFRIGPDRG